MPTPAILPSQKNELLRLLTDKGFAPSEFKWEEDPAPGEDGFLPVKLIHQPTGFFCRFKAARSGSGKPFTEIEYSPSEDGSVKREGVSSSYGWNVTVQMWVDALRNELDTPDLWTVSSQQNSVVSATATASDNTPFNTIERAQVVLFITEVRNYVQANAGLSTDKLNVVLEKLSYLEAASERLGRKDWMNLFLGVILSTAIQVGMEKSAFQDLLSFAGQMFRQFLQYIILLPLPH